MSDDFDGLDLNTQPSTFATAAAPDGDLLRDINAALEHIARQSPVPAACGSEESPHRYFGEEKVGSRVHCAICGERFTVMPNGRGIPDPKLADMFKAPPLRVLDMPEPPRVPPEYRYAPVLDARERHLPIVLDRDFDERRERGGVITLRLKRRSSEAVSRFIRSVAQASRRAKRLARREPNRTRSSKRTDAARDVPAPVLGDLVTHICTQGHRYAGPRCPLCTPAKVLTARQWRAMERAQDFGRRFS